MVRWRWWRGGAGSGGGGSDGNGMVVVRAARTNAGMVTGGSLRVNK